MEIRTISEAIIEKEKSLYLQESSQVAQGTTVVCLISSHYVSAKTASRTADIAVLLDSKEEKSGVARVTRMYAMRVAGAKWSPEADGERKCGRRPRVPEISSGGDTWATCSRFSGTLRGRRGHAEINFPGLCKDRRLRFVHSAGIKVGSAPNGPRVARELHAGNHRERRATLYM